MDDAELEVLRKGLQDPPFFCRTFLSHWFPAEMPWFHRGLLAILLGRCGFLEAYGEVDLIIEHFQWTDEAGTRHPIFSYGPDGLEMSLGPKTLAMIPRGYSKTTLCNAASIIEIVYGLQDFIVYISEAGTHSAMQLANIKSELETNAVLIHFFGPQKPDQRQGVKWAEDFFETINGVAMASRGRGAQVRGLNHKGKRPTKIVLDDVEDKESVATEAQRLKTRAWFFGDVEPALAELNPDSKIIALGTLLHREALLQTFSADPEWNTIRLGIRDRAGNMLWPLKDTAEKDEARRRKYQRVGLLHVYYLEYWNEIRGDGQGGFKPEQISILPRALGDTVVRALAYDPAISEKDSASFVGFAVVGMTENGILHIYDIHLEIGMTPRAQVDKYFELSKKWQVTNDLHGVESIAFQSSLIHTLREEMFRKRHYFEIQPLTHSQKKEERIRGILGPRYHAGYVTQQRHWDEYEAQLLDFPQGKLDGPDVVAMAFSLLDRVAGLASDGDPQEDELEDLDLIMGGDWRSY